MKKSSQQFLILVAVLFMSAQVYAIPQEVDACYTVPVQFHLKKFASFPIAGTTIEKSAGGAITIKYRLPEDITGKGGFEIKLSSPASNTQEKFFAVTEHSTDTRGLCVPTSTGFTCMLHYAKLDLDKALNHIFLKSKYPNDVNLEQRLEVLDTFGGDAVGILEISY